MQCASFTVRVFFHQVAHLEALHGVAARIQVAFLEVDASVVRALAGLHVGSHDTSEFDEGMVADWIAAV